MPGPYDRTFDDSEPYTYTLDSETDEPSYSSELKAYYSSELPSAGYPPSPSPPSSASSAPSKPSAAGPTDDAIDAMLASSGGRITSRMMRQLERQAQGGSSSSKLPQWPPAPPSTTDQKRQKIMSRIKKTKTKDSAGGDLSFAGKDDAPLAGKQLVDHYKGEDKSVAWRMMDYEQWAARRNRDPKDPDARKQWEKQRDSDKITTRYDTAPSAREKSRLKEKSSGKVKTTHDTREYNDWATEHGWVMSPDTGDVHTFDHTNHQRRPDGKQVNMHHSSPLAGGDVAGAGLMKIEDKHITEVTDESGHYRPEGEYTYQAVNQMAKRGLLDRKAKSDDREKYQTGRGNLSARVTLAGAVGRDGRPGKGWLNDEEGINKDALTLPYQAFLQTRGNERQARAKVSMQEELLGKVPEAPATSEGMGASSLESGPSQSVPAAQSQSVPAAQSQAAPAQNGSYFDFDELVQQQEQQQAGSDPGTYTVTSTPGYSYGPIGDQSQAPLGTYQDLPNFDEDSDVGAYFDLDEDSDEDSDVGAYFDLDEDSDEDSDVGVYEEVDDVESTSGYANVDSYGNIIENW